VTDARAEVVVDATPDAAFRLFTDDIGLWWRAHTRYWNDPDRGLHLRLEPGVGGRWIEVYDADAGTGFEVGRVTVWEPGERLGLTWSQAGWSDGMTTDIEVTFEAAGGGTRVRLVHRGFELLGAGAAPARAGYQPGWNEVLGWFAEHATKEAP
jgi:uncharacterized protein YndB with AHSA1/START domain